MSRSYPSHEYAPLGVHHQLNLCTLTPHCPDHRPDHSDKRKNCRGRFGMGKEGDSGTDQDSQLQKEETKKQMEYIKKQKETFRRMTHIPEQLNMSRSDPSHEYAPLGVHHQLNLCTLTPHCPDHRPDHSDKLKNCRGCFGMGKEGDSGTDQDSQLQKEETKKQMEYIKKQKETFRRMTHIPLILRTNAGIEFPTENEVKSGHKRLSDYLQLYDLVERIVMGDGNCQYRALSDQIYRTEDNYDHVKKKVIEQLKKMPQNYSGFILTDEYPTFDAYIEKISSIGEWGDNWTLQAAADAFGATIYIFSVAYPDGVIAIPPSSRSTRVCYISRWAEVHYNSVYLKVD